MALWDITTGECERVFSVNGSVVCLQVVGNSVVAGFGDNSIQIWEWYALLLPSTFYFLSFSFLTIIPPVKTQLLR